MAAVGSALRQLAKRVFALFFALFLTLLYTIVLTACSSLQPPADKPLTADDNRQAFALAGRFSLRQEEQSYAGRLDWRHTADSDELLFSSPLGQGIAEIVSTPAGARLTHSDGRSQSAASADQLLQSALGYPLPLDKLADWVRGRSPHGGEISTDAFGRPARLRYQDWRIVYEYDSDDPQALPGRLFVEREAVLELRLRIDQWRALPSPEPVADSRNTAQ